MSGRIFRKKKGQTEFLLCNEKHLYTNRHARLASRDPRTFRSGFTVLIKIDEATKLAASSVRSILKIPSGSHA